MINWKQKERYYYKILMDKEHFGVELDEIVLLRGNQEIINKNKYAFGYYILDGEITIHDKTYTQNTLLWFTGGKTLSIFLQKNVHALFIESHTLLKSEEITFDVFIDELIEWNHPLKEKSCCSRHMIKAEDYGIKFQTGIYTKGCEIPWHTHSIAHGFYVLDGILKVSYNDKFELYGPGEFVVTEANEYITHHQVEDSDYVRYIFIANGIFDFIVDGVTLRA